MRTVGDLALLTGISVNTIKYYAKPYQPSNKGQRSTGAGYLTPTSGKNGVRQFDDDDLIMAYIIGLLHESKIDQETIRGLCQNEDRFSKTIECGLTQIEKERAELERREQILKTLQRAAEEFDSDDDSSVDAFVHDALSLAVDSIMRHLENLCRKSPEQFKRMVQDADEETRQLSIDIYKLASERRNLVIQGATSREIQEIDGRIASTIQKQNSNWEVNTSALVDLIALCKDDAEPGATDVQDTVHALKTMMSPAVSLPNSLFEECVKATFTGNSIAVLLDLMEEGFVKWLLKAVHIYVSTPDKEAVIG